MEAEDLYSVLGIEGGGSQVSQLDVRKAYRTRALLWHPDKQVGKNSSDVAAAAVEFDKVQKAHEVLGDEKARKAYDELWTLRKNRLEKEKQLSSKRQKMMQDLRDRERAFESERAEKREEELATRRLRAEIARIRAEHAKKRTINAEGADFSFVSTGKSTKSQPATGPAPARTLEMQNTLNNTLKVTWSCTDGGAGGYNSTRLKEIFEEFGTVEDVVIRPNKSRRKGTAWVVMASNEAVNSATSRPCGDLSNPLLVVPFESSRSTRTEPAVNSQNVTGNVAGLVHVIGAGYRSYENDILTKMRQAAERARIIKEMQEADAKTS